jgi:hypothetical protein
MKDHLPLVHAVLDALVFLDSAGPNEVDPDSALRSLESIAASIHLLDIQDQQVFLGDLSKIASESDDLPYRKFVESVPAMLGLI